MAGRSACPAYTPGMLFCSTHTNPCLCAQAMSEDSSDYAAADSDYEGDGGSDDEQDDKELLIECGQRQVGTCQAQPL